MWLPIPFSSARGAKSAPPNPSAGSGGYFEAEKKEGKEKGREGKKEGNGKKGWDKTPPAAGNNFGCGLRLVCAVCACSEYSFISPNLKLY